jgi:hypothetical protein
MKVGKGGGVVAEGRKQRAATKDRMIRRSGDLVIGTSEKPRKPLKLKHSSTGFESIRGRIGAKIETKAGM